MLRITDDDYETIANSIDKQTDDDYETIANSIDKQTDDDYETIANSIDKQTDGEIFTNFYIDFEKNTDVLFIEGIVSRCYVEEIGASDSIYSYEVLTELKSQSLSITNYESYDFDGTKIGSDFDENKLKTVFEF